MASDLVNSEWHENDNDNTNPSPNGVQGGYAPSTIGPIIRTIRGSLKRFYVQSNAIYTSTGSGSAFVLTYEVAPGGYSKGITYRFWAHADNTGAATLNINGLNAKSIVTQAGAALTAGQIKAGRVIEVVYNGTNFTLLGSVTQDASFTGNTSFGAAVFSGLATFGAGATSNGTITANTFVGNGAALTSLNATNITTGTLDDARLPASLAGKTFTTGVAFSGAAATANTDLTKGIALFGNSYGFGVTANNLNYVSGNNHAFYSSAGAELAKIAAGGMTVGGETVLTSNNGILSIAKGGTGGGNVADARTSLSVYSKAEIDAALLSNGRRNLTVSSAAPSGGVNGDVWYQI